MLWRIGDDESAGAGASMAPTRLAGFDLTEPTARNQGKPAAIRLIRGRNPYSTVVMVGDGITDLEAVQVAEGGADLFVGFGGVSQRPAVAAGADWYVFSHDQLTNALRRYRVAMVGAGAWASAAARLLAQNTAGDRDAADRFVDELLMWVYDDDADWPGSDARVRHQRHAREPKVLARRLFGRKCDRGSRPRANGCGCRCLVLLHAAPVSAADAQVDHRQDQAGAIAVSLIKGMRVTAEGPQLISQMVTKYLGMDCSVLMVRQWS
jgi:glycerol-3-phosphate dehydrogenase (NAD+)